MSTSSNQTGNFQLRAYTIAELALVYGVCKRTIKKWIKPFAQDIGPRQGHFYSISQVEIIINKIGLPRDFPLNN